MGKRIIGLVAAGTALTLLTACGPGEDTGKVASLQSSSPPTSTSGAPADKGGSGQDAMLKYAKCMRDHGIDMPDPDPNGGRSGVIKGNPDQAKLNAASDACKSLMPTNDGPPPTMDAATLDKWRKRAQCMRDHGVHMPDPQPDKELQLGSPEDEPSKVAAAMKACGIETG